MIGTHGTLSSMSVTMQDIADELNVSVVTVSKILRNQGRFSAATRERVLRRARELNYRANWVARSLVTRRTFTIGLLLPDFTHLFFAEIAKTIAETVRPQGYHVIVSYFEEDPQLERSEAEALIDRQVDGLVIASSQPLPDTQLVERIRNRKLPLVLIDRPVASEEVSFVGVDNQKVGRMAAEHLVSEGCRRIAILRGPLVGIANDRLAGALLALEATGTAMVPGGVAMAGYSENGGFEAMRKLLLEDSKPDGVVCFSDPVAIGAMRAILGAGLRVPQDIAVVGAGNVHYSDMLSVPLTTVDQRTVETGKRAAELLLAHIASDGEFAPQKVLIEPQLVIRGSSARPAIRLAG
jgi:LacI family transcriptional regulator